MTDVPMRAPLVLSGTGGRRVLLGWTILFQLLATAVLVWDPLIGAGMGVRLAAFGGLGLCFAAWFCAVVRRLHDMGRSGWFAPLFAIPGVGLLLLLWALVAPARELDPERFRPALRYDVALFLILACAAVLASRAVWSPHRMVTDAMAPTMGSGALLVSHRLGLDGLAPGDVVMVNVPAGDGATRRAVGRIVAGGGQSIALEAGRPVLDGTPSMRAPCPDGAACAVETLPGGRSYRVLDAPLDVAPMTVPDDALYLLADNRGAARDRGAGGLGVVPLSAVQGRILPAWIPR